MFKYKKIQYKKPRSSQNSISKTKDILVTDLGRENEEDRENLRNDKQYV